jgi:hypothetical protein
MSSSNVFRSGSRCTSNESHKSYGNVLPTDKVMHRLIRTYFDDTGLLFPYIHKQEFLGEYLHLQVSGFRGNVRRTWLGLLNMTLAMGTYTYCWEDSGNKTYHKVLDAYYRRARDLYQTHMFRSTTLETGR